MVVSYLMNFLHFSVEDCQKICSRNVKLKAYQQSIQAQIILEGDKKRFLATFNLNVARELFLSPSILYIWHKSQNDNDIQENYYMYNSSVIVYGDIADITLVPSEAI